MARFRPLRTLVTLGCVCAAGSALPAAAGAQLLNDSQASPISINGAGTPLPAQSTRAMDTIFTAGTEAGEIIGCLRAGFPEEQFDSTVWYDITPHRPGFLRVVASSSVFQAVVAVMPFNRSTGAIDIPQYRCAVGSLGSAVLDYEFRLQEGAAYKIQVGRRSGTPGQFRLDVYFNADTDRDGLVDSLDLCPSLGGGSATGGCPDSDGDRKIDPQDACPRESARGKRDRNDNGCPDRELIKPETKLNAGTYCTGSICHGIRVKKLVVSEIPRGTKVTVACTKHACRKSSKRAGKSRKVRFFSGKALKAGVGLSITLSRTGFVSRRVTYWIEPNDWKKTNTCLKGGKPVRCTRELLVR